jgi:hypothetical protein
MANKPDTITIPCNALGQERGRYYVTPEIIDLAKQLIPLVEARRGLEKQGPRKFADEISHSRKETDPIWDKLMLAFNALNSELEGNLCSIAYRHFMESTRSKLGYPPSARKVI